MMKKLREMKNDRKVMKELMLKEGMILFGFVLFNYEF